MNLCGLTEKDGIRETKIKVEHLFQDTSIIETRSFSQKRLLSVSLIVSFYIIVSITTVLVNKMVLKVFRFPMTLLWLQMVLAVIFLHFLHLICLYKVPTSSILDYKVIRQLYPLILVNVIGLILNTMCLDTVDVLVYQVTRSMVLPLNLFIGLLIDHKLPSIQTSIACITITLGFLFGTITDQFLSEKSKSAVLQDHHLMAKTLIFGFGSALMAAISSHIIKKCFDDKNRVLIEPSKLVYTNNFYSLIILFPVVLVKESKQVILSISGTTKTELIPITGGILISGVLGLLINLAGYLQIKATSPLSHTISASARGVLQTILACSVLGEKLSSARAISIVLILIGTAIYTISKV